MAPPNGNYRFIGHWDHMAKSPGCRFEPGEITQAIYEDDPSRATVLVAIPDEETGSRLRTAVVAYTGFGVMRTERQGCVRSFPGQALVIAQHRFFSQDCNRS